MSSTRELQGKTAVITGGASGIGAAMAAELCARGVSVVIGDIDEGGARAVAECLNASGGQAQGEYVDVTDLDSVTHFSRVAESRYGSVQLLFSNAGVLAFGTLTQATLGDWRWMSGVNIEGLLNCVHAFLPSMSVQRGWRHIAATASTHAFIPGAGGTALYSATKHAAFSIIQALRLELAGLDIGVTAICPGQVSTGILDAQRNRPDSYGPKATEPFGTGTLPGIDAADVARQALDGVLSDCPVVFALAEREHFRTQIAEQWRLIDDTFNPAGAAVNRE